jgi:hypothetical protein
MPSKLSFWLTNTLVSVATTATVLFAAGRSQQSSYAALLQLGTSTYSQLCQLPPIVGGGSLPDSSNPRGEENEHPDSGNGGSPTNPPASVPEPSGTGGLAILAVLWAGAALAHKWTRHSSKSALLSEK